MLGLGAGLALGFLEFQVLVLNLNDGFGFAVLLACLGTCNLQLWVGMVQFFDFSFCVLCWFYVFVVFTLAVVSEVGCPILGFILVVVADVLVALVFWLLR